MNRPLYLSGTVALVTIVGLHIGSSAKAPSIIGHTVDGAGYPVPGASVTVMPEAGGLRKSAMTGADGAYQFESLPEGTYGVDFEILGFDLARRNHVRVRQNSTASADGTVFVSGVCDASR
jgi:Carboxypeptidase regulatory-like domain